MEWLLQFIDDVDDLVSLLLQAASPRAIAVILISIVSLVGATYAAGLRGLLLASLLIGLVAALAGFKPQRRQH